MRTSKLYLSICAATITLSVFIFTAACHKSPASEDISYAADQATTEQTFNDVQTIADQASTVTSGGSLAYRTTGSACATVTHTPGTITIDFGANDCRCNDGRLRRGQIIVTYTGNYTDIGSVHTITFNNYFQHDNKVTGSKTVTNMGNNASGQPYFNIEISGAVTLQSGGTISAVWTRVRTWTQGYLTPNVTSDDVYQITGSGSMTAAGGQHVNINITSPLVVAVSCHWIEAGSVTYTLAGGAERVLNYGNTPVCDDLATLTLANGTTRNITLP